MSEYIKRDAAVKMVAVILCSAAQARGYDVSLVDCIREADAWVKDYCPTVEAKTKRGSWEARPAPPGSVSPIRYYCSVCGAWNSYGKSDYCPSCGAKMEKESEPGR